MLKVTRDTLKDADAILALIPFTKKNGPFDRAFAEELHRNWLKKLRQTPHRSLQQKRPGQR